MLRRALLYARTAVRLRPRQWLFQVVRRLQGPRRPAGRATRSHLSPDRLHRLAPVVRGWAWRDQNAGTDRADEVVADRYRFLGHVEILPTIDWTRPYVGHLWSYHLHYFEYAIDLAYALADTGEARYGAKLEELILSWIRQTRDASSVGWEPYAVAVRMVNWTYALLVAGERMHADTRAAIATSLGRQASHLARRLEYHVDGNHLQKDYHALATAGLVLSGRRADRWWRTGSAGMWRCLMAQTAPDGGHLERSPLYHLQALADYLQLLALMRAVGREPPPRVVDRLRAMVEALGPLSRPDGSLHLFADSAHGHGPPVAAASRAAAELLGGGLRRASGMLALPDTGYLGVSWPEHGVRLIADCGEFGARYQPGHGHCDTLSFELDLGGRPVLVDAGVGGYADDPLRTYCRSTRAHNTVAIDGKEQSEIWGTFRVARRVDPGPARHWAHEGGYALSGSCRPYHDRDAVHERRLQLSRDGTLRVRDRVTGATGARLESFLHFAPDLDVSLDGDVLRVVGPGVDLVVSCAGVDDIRLVRGRQEPSQGWHCPAFGTHLPAWAVELVVHSNDGRELGFDLAVAP